MQRSRSLIVIVFAVLFGISILSASASIQEMVDAANPGDTITIAAGIYKENVHVNKSLTIIGIGADNTIIDGNRTGPVFTIGKGDPNIYVTLYGMNIKNGIGSLDYVPPSGNMTIGGGILNKGMLTIDHCIIQNNGGHTTWWNSLPKARGVESTVPEI